MLIKTSTPGVCKTCGDQTVRREIVYCKPCIIEETEVYRKELFKALAERKFERLVREETLAIAQEAQRLERVRQANREYMRRYCQQYPERKLASNRAWQQANRERLNAERRAKYAAGLIKPVSRPKIPTPAQLQRRAERLLAKQLKEKALILAKKKKEQLKRQRAYKKAWTEANKERQKALKAAWHQRNKARMNEKMRKNYRENREKRLEQVKIYVRRHAKKVQAYKRDWHLRNYNPAERRERYLQTGR